MDIIPWFNFISRQLFWTIVVIDAMCCCLPNRMFQLNVSVVTRSRITSVRVLCCVRGCYGVHGESIFKIFPRCVQHNGSTQCYRLQSVIQSSTQPSLVNPPRSEIDVDVRDPNMLPISCNTVSATPRWNSPRVIWDGAITGCVDSIHMSVARASDSLGN